MVTRYASESVCTHLSEWGEPKNIDVSHDFDDDDDNNHDDNGDDNNFDLISQCIFLFSPSQQFLFGRKLAQFSKTLVNFEETVLILTIMMVMTSVMLLFMVVMMMKMLGMS